MTIEAPTKSPPIVLNHGYLMTSTLYLSMSPFSKPFASTVLVEKRSNGSYFDYFHRCRSTDRQSTKADASQERLGTRVPLRRLCLRAPAATEECDSVLVNCIS